MGIPVTLRATMPTSSFPFALIHYLLLPVGQDRLSLEQVPMAVPSPVFACSCAAATSNYASFSSTRAGTLQAPRRRWDGTTKIEVS